MKKPKESLRLPDNFVLEKSDVLMIINSVEKHWKKNNFSSIENAAYIANMEIMKTAVRFNSTKVLGELYYSIIVAVHEIETLNSLKLSIDSGEKKIQVLFDKQVEKIKDGSAFIDN